MNTIKVSIILFLINAKMRVNYFVYSHIRIGRLVKATQSGQKQSQGQLGKAHA